MFLGQKGSEEEEEGVAKLLTRTTSTTPHSTVRRTNEADSSKKRGGGGGSSSHFFGEGVGGKNKGGERANAVRKIKKEDPKRAEKSFFFAAELSFSFCYVVLNGGGVEG